MSPRLIRRMAGVLAARLPELGLEKVEDPRAYARKWSVPQLLGSVLLGLLAGCRSLGEVEVLGSRISISIRRLLGLPGRMADTTMRDFLCKVEIDALRRCLHRLVRAAHRRKALRSELPFHVVAMDGKVTALPCLDRRYVQRRVLEEEPEKSYGLMRTVSCTLVSAAGRPCIDAIPIPAATNEVGYFQEAFAKLNEAYPRLFQVVTYDAGALSEANGRSVVEAGKDYFFRLKGEERILYKMAAELIDPDDVAAETVDVLGCATTVTRRVVVLPIERQWSYDRKHKPAESIWPHAKSFVRVETEVERRGEVVERDVRVYVTSLEAKTLTCEQWLALARSHWGVENNTHHTLDVAFEEDERPWIVADGHGMLAVLILRRIALTLLGLFRSVTQRSEEKRAMPWKQLLSWVRDTLVAAREEHLEALRARRAVPVMG